ncbi:MAG: hypothetical protein AVDCRST_MAG36-1539, partial [uncultured Nocardioidaceae bacterium]
WAVTRTRDPPDPRRRCAQPGGRCGATSAHRCGRRRCRTPSRSAAGGCRSGRRGHRTCWGWWPRTCRRRCTSSTRCGRGARSRRAPSGCATRSSSSPTSAPTPSGPATAPACRWRRSAASAGQADPHRERLLHS